MRYTSLWATKDAARLSEINVFWVFVEASIRTWINCRLRVSPTMHNSLQSAVEFKEDMHNLYIQACKDPAHKWVNLLFIATDDVIFAVMESWPLEWCTLDLAAMEKITEQQWNKDTKLHIVQLAERRRHEQEAHAVEGG